MKDAGIAAQAALAAAPTEGGGAFATASRTSRFLTQATFGPTPGDVTALTGTSASQWFLAELVKPPSRHLPTLREYNDLIAEIDVESSLSAARTSLSFWLKSITAEDQLRQRTAFALSEIIVVSNAGGELLSDIAEAVSAFQDILITGAFANFRQVLERVTYSPAMGYYLTYMGSKKANPMTGQQPDENYARELLQLFTIGLIELNPDGTPRLGEDGLPIETYDNDDITGLAKVFTGLNLNYDGPEENIERVGPVPWSTPMRIIAADHSQAEKRFLGTSIPEFTDAATSIDLALDAIFAHPNVGPFLARQLIQRLTTSNPAPAYVQRVASAFDTGSYVLPDGTPVGAGIRGDLAATVAAVLFDEAVRDDASLADATFGKIREPVLRFTSWARAFSASTVTPELTLTLWESAESTQLAQHPYRAPSVFNFFRPGYVAPGTQSGALGLTVPELQLVNATTTPGYTHYLTFFIRGEGAFTDVRELAETFRIEGIRLDPRLARSSFLPDYSTEIALASDPVALVDHLASKLTYDTLRPEMRTGIVRVLNALRLDPEVTAQELVEVSLNLLMSSPDYLVQR